MTETLQIAPVTSEREHQAIDLLESRIVDYGALTPPTPVHRITLGADGKPNLYSRELSMKAGTLLTSRIHKTEHQFIVTKGAAAVWSGDRGWQPVVAPYHGITEPGTRRVLYIIDDMVWTTFHVVVGIDVESIEAELVEERREIMSLEEAMKEVQ